MKQVFFNFKAGTQKIASKTGWKFFKLNSTHKGENNREMRTGWNSAESRNPLCVGYNIFVFKFE